MINTDRKDGKKNPPCQRGYFPLIREEVGSMKR